MVNNLSFSRFLRLVGLINRIRQEEEKEKLIAGAWIGFQMGAGGDQGFSQYLQSLGLLEGKPESATEMNAKEAIAKAEEILSMAANKKES